MNKTAESYGRALFDLSIPVDVIDECKQLVEQVPELLTVLSSPAITSREKHRIIERVFPVEIHNFLKVLCDNGHMGEAYEVAQAYEECRMECSDIIGAELHYANGLNPELVEKLKQTIVKKYKKAGVKLIVRHDPSLISGFVLRVGDQEYDCSAKGKLTHIYRKLAWR